MRTMIRNLVRRLIRNLVSRMIGGIDDEASRDEDDSESSEGRL